LPIYQRNIIRQELAKLNEKEKEKLTKEIKDKNQELRRIKMLVKTATKKLITFPSILQLNTEIEYSKEVYLRLLYS
jgi:hypothetical protein